MSVCRAVYNRKNDTLTIADRDGVPRYSSTVRDHIYARDGYWKSHNHERLLEHVISTGRIRYDFDDEFEYVRVRFTAVNTDEFGDRKTSHMLVDVHKIDERSAHIMKLYFKIDALRRESVAPPARKLFASSFTSPPVVARAADTPSFARRVASIFGTPPSTGAEGTFGPTTPMFSSRAGDAADKQQPEDTQPD